VVKLLDLLNQILSEERKKADRCLRIARRKYDKSSAYRSGAIVRCRQGKIWRGLKEEENPPNIEYIKPNFEYEWEEAIRYPEFKKMGFDNWVKTAQKGYEVNFSDIKDKLKNVDLNFDSLNQDKKIRFINAFKTNQIELPIAVKFSENDYDLVGGNTRLSGLVRKGIDPKIWIVDLTTLKEDSSSIKSEIEYVFDTNPALASIGTPEQYSQYVASIFPNSKVKGIVYHGTMEQLSPKDGRFKGYVTYFTDSKNYVETFGFPVNRKIIAAVINVKSPYYAPSEIADVPEEIHNTDEFTNPRIIKHNNPQFDSVVGVDAGQKEGITVAVFYPEQIHILGSRQDIEGFKNFTKILKEDNQPSEGSYQQALKDIKPIIPVLSHNLIHQQSLEHNEENMVKLNQKIFDLVKKGDGTILDRLWDLAGNSLLKNAINIITFYHKSNLSEAKKETLRTWFKRKGAPGKTGGWVDCNSPIRKDGKVTGYKPCGRQKGEERAEYPSCRPTAARCKDKDKGTKWGKTK
jgi:hypothetical protein